MWAGAKIEGGQFLGEIKGVPFSQVHTLAGGSILIVNKAKKQYDF